MFFVFGGEGERQEASEEVAGGRLELKIDCRFGCTRIHECCSCSARFATPPACYRGLSGPSGPRDPCSRPGGVATLGVISKRTHESHYPITVAVLNVGGMNQPMLRQVTVPILKKSALPPSPPKKQKTAPNNDEFMGMDVFLQKERKNSSRP